MLFSAILADNQSNRCQIGLSGIFQDFHGNFLGIQYFLERLALAL
jgi:hypothetical protein